jgi:hypothetical protein
LHRLPPQQSRLRAFYGIASGMARPSQNHAKVPADTPFLIERLGPFDARRQACVLPAKSCTLHRYRNQAETVLSPFQKQISLGESVR